jgi:CubicO group peptidase (beta-lactamase class C family)
MLKEARMRWTIIAVAGFTTLAGPLAAQAATGVCPNPAFLKQAQAAISAYSQADTFSGAVLVAVDGKPVLRQGVGLAERELGVANTPGTKFRIGSITKQFTATAILQLQEAGKLSIDDPISKYYADAPPAWSKVTLRHLLTHTSGIPTYTALPGFFDKEARQPHTPEELIKLTRDKPLEFEPGSKFAYDNSGYILLGYVVEKVSGQRYADYVQQHIFTPLGMTGSGYDDSGRLIPGRAAGYDRGPDGKLHNAAFLDMSVPYAAGSLYSTVDDMLLWDQAIYAAKLLKPDSLKAMATNYGHNYGFGFSVDQKWGQDRVWHNGGINGFTASFQRYPKAHVTAVALNNQQSPATDKVAADLAGLCLGSDVYPKEAAETPANLKRFAGWYTAAPSQVVKIEASGANLVAQTSGQQPTTYYPEGGGKFFARTAEVQLAFQTGADGQVTGALISPAGGQPIPAKRIDAAEADRLTKAMAERVASKTASPGTEEALRRFIAEMQKGETDYSRLSPQLASAVRQSYDQIRSSVLLPLGALKTVTFQEVGPGGMDRFNAAFEKGSLQFGIMLGENGRIEGLNLRPGS